MTPVQKGASLSVLAAFGAAVFLLPYKQAGTLMERDMVVMTTMLVAAILNSAAMLVGDWRQLRIDRIAVVTALIIGVLTIAANIGSAMALRYVDAGVTSSLQQTQILLVPLAGFVLLGERVTVRFVIGTVIVIVGIAAMRISTSSHAGIHVLGIAWALLSAGCFALMHVITRKVIDRIQPVVVNALRLWVTVGLLLAVPGNAAQLPELGAEAWLLCAAAALAGPLVSRTALMFAVRYISASHSIMITLICPVFAFSLDFLILGAAPSRWQLIGAAIMLIGVSLPVLELMAGDARPSGADGAAAGSDA